MTPCPYGFRIVGSTWDRRRLVDADAALAAYAACDERAELDREAYLSAFQFDATMRERADAAGRLDVKGFAGNCWSPWLWFDIDRDGDLPQALADARRLAAWLADRYRLDGLLAFTSGAKGFHIGLPTGLWSPEPSPAFPRLARSLAERLAEGAGVRIDAGVYDAVRAFRAPNSRHPKTGRHKRQLALDELLGLSLDRILRLAEAPAPFALPTPPKPDAQAAADWREAVAVVERRASAQAERRAVAGATLNRATLAFIRQGTGEGDRHRILFSAAANLAEFGCPPDLAHALLSEAALDCGLPPKEVRRQIDCGLADGRRTR